MNRRTALGFVFAAGLARPATAQLLRPSDVDLLKSKPADARVTYGPDSLEFGDLRLPSGKGPFPVAIVIHGGCWISYFASLQNTAAAADALRDAGIATWNVEYRRTDHPGGGWPGSFLDIANAADQLRALARRYPLDTTRVVAVGHSAGGHFALWLAARPKLPPGSPIAGGAPLGIRGAISLGGPGDLAEIVGRPRNACYDGVRGLMGGTPADVADRYAQGSPIELLPLGVAQWLIIGDQDGIMPPGPRTAYTDKARAAGDRITLAVVPKAGHFEVIAPTTEAWPVVLAAVRSALGLSPSAR